MNGLFGLFIMGLMAAAGIQIMVGVVLWLASLVGWL